MAFKAADLSRVRVLDLSQNFSVDSPPFAFYEGPTVKWVKKMAFEGVNAQLISSTNHIATHLDSPLHFNDPGPDVAGIPLESLLGPACIVDLSQFGVGDYDIYGPEHFERWERKHKIKIQRGDILVIHTGYHHYYNEDWYKTRNREKPNLPRAFLKHPGPQLEFCDWVLDRGVRWLAVDAISTDHPFNTNIRRARPDLVGHIDGVAIHPYAADPFVVLARVPGARSTLDAIGLSHVPPYVTTFRSTPRPPGALS